METVDNNDDDDAEDDAQEVEELERQPLVGAKTGTATDLTDVGLWPVKVDREIRAMLVRQGSAAVQHLDHEFMEVARSGTNTKGNARKLTKKNLVLSGFEDWAQAFWADFERAGERWDPDWWLPWPGILRCCCYGRPPIGCAESHLQNQPKSSICATHKPFPESGLCTPQLLWRFTLVHFLAHWSGYSRSFLHLQIDGRLDPDDWSNYQGGCGN